MCLPPSGHCGAQAKQTMSLNPSSNRLLAVIAIAVVLTVRAEGVEQLDGEVVHLGRRAVLKRSLHIASRVQTGVEQDSLNHVVGHWHGPFDDRNSRVRLRILRRTAECDIDAIEFIVSERKRSRQRVGWLVRALKLTDCVSANRGGDGIVYLCGPLGLNWCVIGDSCLGEFVTDGAAIWLQHCHTRLSPIILSADKPIGSPQRVTRSTTIVILPNGFGSTPIHVSREDCHNKDNQCIFIAATSTNAK